MSKNKKPLPRPAWISDFKISQLGEIVFFFLHDPGKQTRYKIRNLLLNKTEWVAWPSLFCALWFPNEAVKERELTIYRVENQAIKSQICEERWFVYSEYRTDAPSLS